MKELWQTVFMPRQQLAALLTLVVQAHFVPLAIPYHTNRALEIKTAKSAIMFNKPETR